MIIDLRRFEELARADFEFRRETRYLNGVLKVDLPANSLALKFADGALISIDETKMPDEECRIVVRGDAEQWQALLEDKPLPFYQCLQSANIKHGLHLSNTNETFAYLPALNRMTTLMRQSKTQGAAA